MTTVAGCHQIHIEDKCRYYLWLGDYLARLEDKDGRLEGKEAYREFQERDHDTPEYLLRVRKAARASFFAANVW
jgi:hypothetical protein